METVPYPRRSRLLLTALVFLGPGMAGDLFVVIAKSRDHPARRERSARISVVCVLWLYGLASAPGEESNAMSFGGKRFNPGSEFLRNIGKNLQP